MFKVSILIIMAVAIVGCSTKQVNVDKWTEEEVNTWFEKQEWKAGWDVQPDESINKRSFAKHYHKNPRRWNQAFEFLKSVNLKELPLGKQELEGERLFVAVDEYITKDKADTKYESHKKYIDIQYIIEGEELMGVTTADKAKVTEPYNSETDLAFFDFEGGDDIKCTPTNFVIFFPEDLHRPCMKVNENSKVKKIVVKILID